VTKLIHEYPQFLLLENGLVKATHNLGVRIQYSLEVGDLLATVISTQEMEPVEKEELKKGHKRSKNLRKKQRMGDAGNNRAPNGTNKNVHLEEEAKLALLIKFGCQPKPFFYYHTLLHPDLLSYQEAWRIASGDNELGEWCVGAHFEQSVCPMDHDLVLFYAFKPGYSPQDLAQVIEANKPFALITCRDSSAEEAPTRRAIVAP